MRTAERIRFNSKFFFISFSLHFFSTRWNIRSLNRSYHLLSLLLRQNEATAELYIDRYCNYLHWALIYPPISYNVADINNWTKYKKYFSITPLCVLLLWRNEVSYVSVLLVCYIFRRRISLVVIVFLLLDILHTKAPTIFWQKSDNKYLAYAKKL